MKLLISLRKRIQIIFFILSLVLISLFYNNILHVVHKLCPFALVCFGTLSIKTKLIIYPLTLIFSFIFTALSVFFGRFFCGFICFIGTYQEWVYRLFHKNSKAFIKISHIDEKRLGFIKYLILLFIIIMTFVGLSRIHMSFCPITALAWIKGISLYGLISLVLITISAIFIERFWCRFLCPYGALLNVFQIIAKMLNIKKLIINRNLETCIDCYICCKTCPMNINLLEDEFIEDINCIRCFRCIEKCPKKGTLTSKRK